MICNYENTQDAIPQSIQFPEEKFQQDLDCDIELLTGKIPDTKSSTQLWQSGCKLQLKKEIMKFLTTRILNQFSVK